MIAKRDEKRPYEKSPSRNDIDELFPVDVAIIAVLFVAAIVAVCLGVREAGMKSRRDVEDAMGVPGAGSVAPVETPANRER